MLRLLISDIKQEYGGVGFFIFVKSLLNPSIHACLLVRLAANSKGIIHVIIRNILVAKHSIDVGQSISIGRGLKLPHPFCIVIGTGVVIGDRVTLYQGVTLGFKKGYPKIENDVLIYPNCTIVGAVKIGSAAVIGANSFVDKDVEKNSVSK